MALVIYIETTAHFVSCLRIGFIALGKRANMDGKFSQGL